ncbi:MAG: hypothetical protein L0H15_05560 [Nitrosospira sp.]|nr:hypothetical protein [Nitrosospira sp.]
MSKNSNTTMDARTWINQPNNNPKTKSRSSTSTYSAWPADTERKDDIERRLYSLHYKANGSAVIRLALYVLAKADDEQLAALYDEWHEHG